MQSSRRRRLIAPVGLALVAVTGTAVLTSSALFTSSKTVDGNVFSAGTVDLTATPATSVFTTSNMAPGDTVTAPITVQNTGSLEFRYALADTATGALANKLTLAVKTGVAACNNTGFAASGTSVHDASVLGVGTDQTVFGNKAQGPDTGDRVLSPGASEILCVQVTLPGASTGNDAQAKNADVTFTFDAEQTANNGAVGAVTAPTDIAAASQAGTNPGVLVTWAPSEGAITGYTIMRAVDPTDLATDAGVPDPAWGVIATVPATATSYTDTTGTADTSYLYNVVANTAAGSTPAAASSPSTAALSPAPLAPSGTVTTIANGLPVGASFVHGPGNVLYTLKDYTAIYGYDTVTRKYWKVADTPASSGYIGYFTYSPTTGLLYYSDAKGTEGVHINQVDPTTGAVSPAFTFPQVSLSTTGIPEQGNDLTAAPDGTLYYLARNATNTGMALRTINPATGNSTLIVDIAGSDLADNITVATDGTVYLSSTSSVWRVNPTTGVATKLAAPAADMTHNVIVLPDGSLLLVNYQGAINTYDPVTGASTPTGGSFGTELFGQPWVGSDGALYAMNSLGAIKVKDSTRTILDPAAPSISGMTATPDGHLYTVSGTSLNRFNRLTGEHVQVGTVASGPVGRALTSDANGNVYFLTAGGYLSKYDPITGATTVVSKTTVGNRFVSAAGWSPDGNIYVAATGTLAKVDLSTGIVTTLNSATGVVGTNASSAISVDGSGRVYLATTTGALYRVNTSDGTMTSVGNFGTSIAPGVPYAHGNLYATGSKGVYAYNVATGTVTKVATTPSPLTGLGYSSDGYLYGGSSGEWLYRIAP